MSVERDIREAQDAIARAYTRRRAVFTRAHRTLSLARIAKIAGVSKSRVKQIIDGD